MKLFNISVPKYDPEDFFYEEDAVKEGEIPVH